MGSVLCSVYGVFFGEVLVVYGLDELLCLVGVEQDQDYQCVDEDQGEVFYQFGGQFDLFEVGFLLVVVEFDQCFGEVFLVGEDVQVLDGLLVGEIVIGVVKGDFQVLVQVYVVVGSF